MKTVWKFPFDIEHEFWLSIQKGAQILHVDMQGVIPCVWALVDLDQPLEGRCLRIRGTGREVEDGLRHIATFQAGPMVWHVFEDEKP
jgi:hypothetical protein